MNIRPLREQLADRCVFFTGIFQNPTCKAGVNYTSVRDASQPGMYRWPCHRSQDATTTCLKAQYPTPAEAEAEAQMFEAAGKKLMEDLAKGLCPTCQQKVVTQKQVGRCVYAEPCGHRLGQA